MLKSVSRSNRLFGSFIAVGVVIAASVVTAAVTSPGQVLALPGAAESTLVTVEPTRVLDTRIDVGLTGPFQAAVSRKLTITGSIATYDEATETRATKEVVPDGATGVILNVTAFKPTAVGGISIRPGTLTGVPSTSSLNMSAGQVVPNAVTVTLPTTGTYQGKIDIIYFGGAPDNTVNILIDIVGYTTSTGLTDLVNRVKALENSGVQGPEGVNAESPTRVIWVADDGSGDFTSLSGALAAIGGSGPQDLPPATALRPYLIRIAPGLYNETSPVTLESFVDVEGSGQGITTVTCACGSSVFGAAAATVSAGNISAEIRHLTINNTGPSDYSLGVLTLGVTNESFSMLHVTVNATGTASNYTVFNSASSPAMNNVTATATVGTGNTAIFNSSSSSPSMNNVTATAAGGYNTGVYNSYASPSMNNVTATATGGTGNNGVANGSASPSMNNVTATATGGTGNNYGVDNFTSSPSMNNVTATASGGTLSRGVNNQSSSSPTIRNSSLTGSTNSIRNDSGSASDVADTILNGVATGGTLRCVGVYDTTFTSLSSSCA